MKTSNLIFLILIMSLMQTLSSAQSISDIKCKLWDYKRLFDVPDSVYLADKLVAYNAEITIKYFDEFDKQANTKCIWLTFYNNKKYKLHMQSDFANIKLVTKSSGNIIHPIALLKSKKNFITELKAKKFVYTLNARRTVHVVMLFDNAEEGDKIIIDNLLETEIN